MPEVPDPQNNAQDPVAGTGNQPNRRTVADLPTIRQGRRCRKEQLAPELHFPLQVLSTDDDLLDQSNSKRAAIIQDEASAELIPSDLHIQERGIVFTKEDGETGF